MTKRPLPVVELRLDKIVGGGQALGTLQDGRKVFVWGGLPGEVVHAQLTKKKSHMAEGFVTDVLQASPERVQPLDPTSYLSTSPWQIMELSSELTYKAALIQEAFELHGVQLPGAVQVYTNGVDYRYRNKVEFSWYGQPAEQTAAQPTERQAARTTEQSAEQLDLAFFRRGSKGKVIVDECALLPEPILVLARAIRDHLRTLDVTARELKTLLIRCDAKGNCVWQLYVKTADFSALTPQAAADFPAQGGEVIYSNPQSPASVITERLVQVGDLTLQDNVLGVPFRYATEGFFQVNLALYEQALKDMQPWVSGPVVDLYSGVGTIGLTIGGSDVTLVELNEHAVREMKHNIDRLGIKAQAVLAASETALEYITSERTIIVDPPRAGLHDAVVQRLREQKPSRIIYLSCNPVTQARDVAKLLGDYRIADHKGYDFFPHTPHIEHLVVLELQ